jgi:hypothetical protein
VLPELGSSRDWASTDSLACVILPFASLPTDCADLLPSRVYPCTFPFQYPLPQYHVDVSLILSTVQPGVIAAPHSSSLQTILFFSNDTLLIICARGLHFRQPYLALSMAPYLALPTTPACSTSVCLPHQLPLLVATVLVLAAFLRFTRRTDRTSRALRFTSMA